MRLGVQLVLLDARAWHLCRAGVWVDDAASMATLALRSKHQEWYYRPGVTYELISCPYVTCQ